MSYTRGDTYIWSDEKRVHFWSADGYDGWDESSWARDRPEPDHDLGKTPSGTSLLTNDVDEFVVMRFAQMLATGAVDAAIDRAIKQGSSGGAILRRNAARVRSAISEIGDLVDDET